MRPFNGSSRMDCRSTTSPRLESAVFSTSAKLMTSTFCWAVQRERQIELHLLADLQFHLAWDRGEARRAYFQSVIAGRPANSKMPSTPTTTLRAEPVTPTSVEHWLSAEGAFAGPARFRSLWQSYFGRVMKYRYTRTSTGDPMPLILLR